MLFSITFLITSFLVVGCLYIYCRSNYRFIGNSTVSSLHESYITIVIRSTNKFPPFFIENCAFIIKRCEIACWVTPNVRASSCCVWQECWSKNASNSAPSYTFSRPLRSLSSMSNSPFLNFWNNSLQFLSFKAASPYVSTQAIDAPQLQISSN